MKQHSLPGLPRLFILGTLLVASCNLLHAAGSLSGRVYNRATNTILENVRITIEGTTLEAHSDGNGYFILSGISAGEQKLNAVFTDFKSQQIAVQIIDGEDAELEIYMSQTDDRDEDVVLLEKYTVMAERLSAEAAALNEQKMAPIIKNVVAFEEFGEMGEGNPGEFLKYVPGVSMSMDPSTPFFASIRGLPSDGTLVLMEGNQVASAYGDRSFELNGADTANISHIEVTKSPTPDMPANAIGGSINIIGKSGFRSKKPQLIAKVALTGNYLNEPAPFDASPFRKRYALSRKFETQSVNPSFDLSYFYPINRSIALTFTTNYSKRLQSMDYNYKYWNYTRKQYYKLNKYVVDRMIERALFGVSLDWKPSRLSTFRVTAQCAMDNSSVVMNGLQAYTSSPSGTTDEMISTKANGGLIWEVSQGFYTRINQLYKVAYKFDNNKWKIESDISVSHSTKESDNEADGYPGVVRAQIKNKYVNATGISQFFDGYAPYLTRAQKKAGPYVSAYDPSDAYIYEIHLNVYDNVNRVTNFRLNASRTLEIKIPTEIKMGMSFVENNMDIQTRANVYKPTTGKTTLIKDIDAIAWDYSRQTQLTYPDGSSAEALWIDTDKVFDILQSTDYFTFDAATSLYSKSVNSRELTERISSGFLRVDNRLLKGWLRLVWGVRYEHTEDKGKGVLDDISKTYKRDADGNIIYTGSGADKKPVEIPGLTTYEKYLLRYTERGVASGKSYGDFFPSVNANLALTRNIILRAAYAKTIKRPPMSTITPGITISAPSVDDDDPDDEPTYKLTAKDPALKPWRANNYDLSIEAYGLKNITASVGVFRKDIKDFFSLIKTRVTQEFIEYYGIPEEFRGSRLNVYQNIGNGSVTGLEWSYRQNLKVLPHWARGIQIYANGTHLRLSGERGDDFTGFNPRIINFGMGLTRPKVIARLNISMRGRAYNGSVAASSTYPGGARVYIGEQTIADFNFKYIINKRYHFYFVIKNLTFGGQRYDYVCNNPPADTPPGVEELRFSRVGAAITAGFAAVF